MDSLLSIPTTPSEFRTTDYGTCAYLMARGFALERVERNGSQVIFCFIHSPSLISAFGDFVSNKPIPARTFFHALHRAKRIIQETIQGKHNATTK